MSLSSSQSSLSPCASAEEEEEECWCSTAQIDEVEYIWKINNYNDYCSTGNNLTSPTFSASTNDECVWHLSLVPKGENNEKDTFCLYLYLNKDSTCKKVLAKFGFAIFNNAHEKRYTSNFQCNEFNNELKHNSLGDNWGWTDILKNDETFKNTSLPNDTLTISFQITFFEMNDINFFSMFNRCNTIHLQQLSENLASALENHNFADFTISSQGKDYPVHKVILAARSNYFAKMFESGMKENERNCVEITYVNGDIMGEMLKYIYTGKCGNVHKLTDGLLSAADKYNIDPLKKICVESLSGSLSVDNAPNILVLADQYHENELKSKVIDFILARSSKIMNSTTWNSIMPMYPQLLNDVCKAFSRKLENDFSNN